MNKTIDIFKKLSFLIILSTIAFAYQAGGSQNFPDSLSAGDCMVIFSGMHVESNQVNVSHVKITKLSVNRTKIAPGDSFIVTMTVKNTSDRPKTITAGKLRFYNKKFGTIAPDSPANYEMTDNFSGTAWTGANINLASGEVQEIIFNVQAKTNLARVNPVIIDGYLEVSGQTEDNWWTNIAIDNKYHYAAERIVSVDASGIPFVESILVSPNPAKAGLVTITVNFSEIMDTRFPPKVEFITAGGATVVVNGANWHDNLSWSGTASIPMGQSNIYDGTAIIKVLVATDNFGDLMVPNDNAGTFVIDTISPNLRIAYRFDAMPGMNFDIQAIGSEPLKPFSLMLAVKCDTSTVNCPIIWDSNQAGVTWNGHFEIPVNATVGSIAVFSIDGIYSDLAGNVNNVNSGSSTVVIEESIPVFEKIYFDRALVFNGQTVSNRPFVEAYVRHVKAPAGINLKPESIRVTVDNRLVISGESLVQVDTSLFMFDFSLPQDLSLGTHVFEFIIQDSNSNWARPVTVSVQVVSNTLEISEGPLPLPNPFSPNGDGEKDFTYIVYTLTKSTDISLRIYDLNSNLVWRREFREGTEGAHSGLNKVIWDGRDSYNNLLDNGIYLCYVFQKKESGLKILGKTKIFILK